MAVARVLPKVKRDNTTCCGYWLANRAARFRYQHIIDFSTLTSLDQVTTAGWGISHGWQIAGANPSTGQVAMANENNVKLVRGVGLTLTVPGRQSSTAKTFSSAEITFPHTVLGGYFEVEAKVTSVPGTIFEIMTLHGDPWDAPLGWQDTGAMKIGSSTLMKGNSYGLSPGTQMANVHPDTGVYTRTTSPFPADPSTGYHIWSYNWLPILQSTCVLNQNGVPHRYRYDGTSMSAPTNGYSTHPSQFILSHSTNADPAFSAGPPTTDAVITIKRIRVWYDLPNKIANGACPTRNAFDCTAQMSCEVTPT